MAESGNTETVPELVDTKKLMNSAPEVRHSYLWSLSKTARTKTEEKKMSKHGPTSRKESNVADILTYKCPEHDEIITQYCEIHDETACSSCITEHHKSCQSIKFIPDISKGIKDSDDCQKVQKTYNKLIHQLGKQNEEVTESSNQLKQATELYKQAALKHRNKLVEIIDRLQKDDEKDRKAEVDKTRETHSGALNRDHLKKLNSAMFEISEKIKDGHESSLFVLLKQSDELIHESYNILQVKSDIDVKYFEFNKEAWLYHFLTGSYISELVTIRYPYFYQRIPIAIPSEKSSCSIYASHILPDGRPLVADYKNMSVKLFKIQRHYLSNSSYTMQSRPYDIAPFNSDKVMVSLPENKTIQCFSLTDKLTIGREIKTIDICCRSVAYSEAKEKLIAVTYTGQEIVELDMNGNKKRTIMKYTKHIPWYVKVHPGNGMLYVTVGDSVRCLTLDGDEIAVYINDDLKLPQGLVVHPDGSLYICGHNSNNIHHIRDDCTEIDIPFTSRDVSWPWSVSLDKLGIKLYVSEREKDQIKVFKLI